MKRQNLHYRRLRARLIAERGGACQRCGATDGLEFAHVAPTGLNGRGRGYNQRARDVQAHPEAYELLCELCHTRLDLENIPFRASMAPPGGHYRARKP